MSNLNYELVSSILGEEPEEIEIRVSENTWQGLGLIDYPEGSLKSDAAMYTESIRPRRRKKIQENWRIFHKHNIRLWSHSGVDVYAIPMMPVLDILLYANVGQVPYLSNSDVKNARTLIHSIYSTLPFEIISASSDYVEAKFISEVDLNQARIFQNILIEIDVEIINAACFEIYGTDKVDHTDVVAKAIMKNNGFWLHWE
jgi:hypothetical protein